MNNLIAVNQIPAINQIIAEAEIKIGKITGYTVNVEIKNVKLPSQVPQGLSMLQTLVCGYYNVTWLNVIGQSRKGDVLTARHVFAYLAFKMYRLTKSEIGRMILKDHTSVMHSIKKISDFISINDPIQNELQTIIAKLNETKN